MPGVFHARVLRSPVPHARVARVDVSAVLPRVVTLTGDDVSDLEPAYGPMIADQPVVARDRVRYIGDVVAAVAAPTEREADEALGLIAIEYEELAPAFEPAEAMAGGPPLRRDPIPAGAGLSPM